MGHARLVLCHFLYAWEVSYGLDERGMYDSPNVSRGPIGSVNLQSPGENETRGQRDRQRRTEKLHCGAPHSAQNGQTCDRVSPSWGGVRSLKCRSLRISGIHL